MNDAARPGNVIHLSAYPAYTPKTPFPATPQRVIQVREFPNGWRARTWEGGRICDLLFEGKAFPKKALMALIKQTPEHKAGWPVEVVE